MDTSLRHHTRIGPASLILGPALMSVGDLLHPRESWDSTVQVGFIAAAPDRWYAAHLLLFIGGYRAPELLASVNESVVAIDERPEDREESRRESSAGGASA